jgi:hypothetical protein
MEWIPRPAREITVTKSGADLLEMVQRILGETARQAAYGQQLDLMETCDLLRVTEECRKIKEVVEQIFCGQYP